MAPPPSHAYCKKGSRVALLCLLGLMCQHLMVLNAGVQARCLGFLDGQVLRSGICRGAGFNDAYNPQIRSAVATTNLTLLGSAPSFGALRVSAFSDVSTSTPNWSLSAMLGLLRPLSSGWVSRVPSALSPIALHVHAHGGAREESKRMDRKIMKQPTAKQVLELVVDAYQHPGFVDPIYDGVNAVTCFVKFAQMPDQMSSNIIGSNRFQSLLNFAVLEMKFLVPNHLADLAVAITTLHGVNASVWQEQLMVLIWDALPAKLNHCSPSDLSNFAWCLANWPETKPSFIHDIAQRSVVLIDKFLPNELSQLAWSVATMNYRDVNMMNKISEVASRSHLASYDLQNLGRLAWAFARLSIPALPLQLEICEAVPKARISDGTPAEEAFAYALIMLTSSRLGLLFDTTVDFVASRMMTELKHASAYTVAAMLLALEESHVRHHEFLMALSQEAIMRGITDRDLDEKALLNPPVWIAIFRERAEEEKGMEEFEEILQHRQNEEAA